VDFFMPWTVSEPRTLRQHTNHLFLLTKALRSWQPEIVHSFSRLAYLLATFRTGVPMVMSYQRHTGGKRIGRMARLFRNKLRFTACSEFIAVMGRTWGGEWDVIPNFVDCEFFEFRDHVSGDAPLVFLSRVEEIKGTHLAIEMAKRAGCNLVIAGNRVNDPSGERYWNDFITPHLDDRQIRYVGPIDDKQKNKLLGGAAALLVPIQWGEPFGIVFVEALACGTPIISYPKGALREIVSHGVQGFLVESVEEGVDAIHRINTISRTACRERAEEKFSAQVVTKQYERLYKRMVTRAR
jgi:glycosyltransferase involved in cell wall biosynthesis